MSDDRPPTGLHRRDVLRAIGAGALALGGGGVLSACAGGLKGSGSQATDTIKIGLVSPQTGPLASFATADGFVVKQARDELGKGITSGGRKRTVEIVVKDSQSNSNRAAEVARELIFNDQVTMIVTSGTPDTTNPVADQCEANGVPCVSTIAPWPAWYFGRGAKPGQAFEYTTMFFLGVDEISAAFISMWQRMDTNKKVGCLWPNDTDANAFRQGFPPVMAKAGYTVVDGGAYQDGISDFSAQIARFKSGEAELFTTTPLPPDFATFWRQATQQGYKPKLATVAKVLLFPSEAEALGPLVKNIATGVWWSPYHPYRSTLTGQTAKELAAAFTKDTGKQWTQALGSVHSLFEIAKQALSSVSDPRDHKAVAQQLKTMKIECVSGRLDFGSGPAPGVAVIKDVGAQWREGKEFPWDVYIVDNTPLPEVPVNGDLQRTA